MDCVCCVGYCCYALWVNGFNTNTFEQILKVGSK